MKPLSKKKVIVIAGIIVIGLLLVAGLANWRAVGSSLATPMRHLLGVERVAQLETVLFSGQDALKQLKYKLGFAEPENPWAAVVIPEVSSQPSGPVTGPATATPAAASPNETPLANQPTAIPTPMHWTLPDVQPFSNTAGEGIWQPYIYNDAGEVVAVRTFLQPDPERPYAVVAVAAFDLANTDLHFVLGTQEPGEPANGPGIIPAEDKVPGKLLAAFNGGFIAEHGHYGAMSDGQTPLGAKQNLATLVIFPDGSLDMGKWGADLDPNAQYQAYRQNAIPIIDHGEINPKVETGTLIDWGANIDDSIVTVRCAIGLDEGNRVLYYFAGPSLSMPTLANAMEASGVYNGMLLDINPTHAHFTAVRAEGDQLKAEPLFPENMEIMNVWVDRYIRSWPWHQDFFYLTAK